MYRSVRIYDVIKQVFGDETFEKIVNFDDDVHGLVTELFCGLKLQNAQYDKTFKRIWLDMYLNRSIKWQTLDLFRLKVHGVMLSFIDGLDIMLANLDDLLSGTSTATSTGNTVSQGTNASLDQGTNATMNDSVSNTKSATHSASGDVALPQDVSETDLSTFVLRYANTLNKSKGSDSSDSDTHIENLGASLNKSTGETLVKSLFEKTDTNKTMDYEKIKGHLDFLYSVIRRFDKPCFSNVWS